MNDSYNDITLRRRQLHLLGELRCPRRVGILHRVSDCLAPIALRHTFVPHAREMAVAATTDIIRVFL
jgi:hypothetical protein